MCGISGCFSRRTLNRNSLYSLGLKLNTALKHRGPDSSGIWINNDSNLLFSHTRLSILDLSDNGSQPMHSACGRYVIIFNGEIYNHKEIKDLNEEKSNNITYKGHSDTEILLECISLFGLEFALKNSKGMFAIALWDKKNKILKLARDRFGEKPLYYANLNNNFLFASEIKALKIFEEFPRKLDYVSIQNFLNYSFIPAPRTIYENVFKLMPATIMEIDELGSINQVIYWNLNKTKKDNYFQNISNQENVEIIEGKLNSIVKSQMISDAPIGAFLSGGTDSTLVSLLMQKNLTNKLNTFSVGYSDSKYDESKDAKTVSSMLNTNHNELILSEQNIINIIPNIASIFDEPFGDSSQLPSILISKFASQKVKVCLTGDGGDEVFGGYNRYLWIKKYWPIISKMPNHIRQTISKLLKIFPENKWDFLYNTISFYKKDKSLRLFGEKIYKVANSINSKTIFDMHDNFLKTGNNSFLKKNYNSISYEYNFPEISLSPIQSFIYMDLKNYLPNDILTKLDRSSMSHSLETRLPFLDHDLVEHVFNLSDDLKIEKNKTKFILKSILEKTFPNTVVHKPKMGFGVPIDKWIKGSLKDWSLDLISPSENNKIEILDYNKVYKIFKKHVNNENNFHHELWNVLMLQSWIENEKI